ncbi:hypothetical protein OG422_09340 [Streptomyces sp. NBC_01525]|uniref:hypothetical protein n=1 Tax=Streptomyces sp. NBC_01525 TaxID=2903893 RepID=UPI0038709B07
MNTGVRPPVGAFALDIRTARVGKVVAVDGEILRLRPVGGGRDWECARTTVRPATVTERLRATTAYVNARSRGELA